MEEKEEQNRKKKNHFSLEFKQEAVELAKKTGSYQAAAELGASENSIRVWRRKLEGGDNGGLSSYLNRLGVVSFYLACPRREMNPP